MSGARSDQAGGVAERSLDDARATAVKELAQHAIGGGLTLDEYAERAVALEQASSADELAAALRRAPVETAGLPPARRARWLVCVFSGSEQRGRWRLSNRLRVVACLVA